MTGKCYGTDDDVIFRTKHVKLKSMGKYNERCLLQDGYAEHVQTCHIFHRQNFIILSLRFLCEAHNFSATPRMPADNPNLDCFQRKMSEIPGKFETSFMSLLLLKKSNI